MRSLREMQEHFAATLERGPSACPGDMFDGAPEKVLRGLKVHANTISHARLLALEESFPITRAAMGELLFNRLTLTFLEAGHDCAVPLASVGQGLADWYDTQNVRREWVVLTRFEWLWLESYHSADAIALCQADFAGKEEPELLSMVVGMHPSARIISSGYGLAGAIGVVSDHPKLLVLRPEEMVLVHTLDDDVTGLLEIFEKAQSLRSGLETFLTFNPNADVMQCLETLIAIGALTKEPLHC